MGLREFSGVMTQTSISNNFGFSKAAELADSTNGTAGNEGATGGASRTEDSENGKANPKTKGTAESSSAAGGEDWIMPEMGKVRDGNRRS